MIKHVILWKLNSTLSEDEKIKVKADIKANLEALVGEVEGLKELKIIIDPMPSSNADVMLDSTLESETALLGYQKHPKHVEAANSFVRPYTEVRMCMDYEV